MTDVEIIDNLIKIRDTAGNNAKEDILKEIDSEDFKQVLKYLYDTQYVFGLSTKKIDKKTSVELKQDCNSIIEVFEYLEKNNTGTDFDIYVVQNFIKKFEDKYKDTLKELFCKKLKIGVTEKTLEKIYPNDFKKFEIMAGEPYFDRVDKLVEEAPDVIVTHKFDGQRVIIRVEDGNVKMYSRNGKLYTGLKDLEKEASQLPNGAYDGELLKLIDGSIVDTSKLPEKSLCRRIYCPKNAEELFSETASIVNSKDEDKKDIAVFLFDMIPLENFDNKEVYNVGTAVRKAKLELLLSTFNFTYIKYANILYSGKFDQTVIKAMLDEMVLLGQEGLMINYADAPYEFKRTNNLVKVKQVYTADVMIRGFEEGTGKNKGKLGALLVKTPQGVEVKVGSGLTDFYREDIWSKQEGYLGTICEIAFTTPSTSKDSDLYNLRFPRLVRMRPEKTEENWEEFDKIIEELSK
jgi:DNA ligase-1